MNDWRLLVVTRLVAGAVLCSTLRAELAWSTLSQSFQPVAGAPTVEADYRFENRGTHAVTITSVSTSCGCTSAKPDKTTYAPGEWGVLHVIFNTAGRSGRQSKTIHVTTDDPKEKPATLRMEIGLSASYVVAPRLLRWKRDEPVSGKQAFLRLAPAAGFGEPALAAAPEGFSVSLQRDPDAANTFLILVTPQTTATTQRGVIAVQLEPPGGEKVSAQLLLVVD